MPNLTLLVKGPPVPKGRPRFNHNTGNVYTPKETRDAEKTLRDLLFVAGARKPDDAHYYSIDLGFQLLDDGSSDAIDLDNLVKLVLDSANKTVWGDDRQVTEIHASLWRTNKGEPHTMIQITQEGPRVKRPRRHSPDRGMRSRASQSAAAGARRVSAARSLR